MSKASSNTSITGRDGLVMAKALYWALKFSQSQPDSMREWNDEEDMKAILNARFKIFATGFKLSDGLAFGLVNDAAASGEPEPEHEKLVAFLTPPNLEPNAYPHGDGSEPASVT